MVMSPLTIITYNIRLCFDSSVEAVANTLKPYGPDIVALQEVGKDWYMGAPGDQAMQIADFLGLDYAIFGPALTLKDVSLPPDVTYNPGSRYGVALLSRFPVNGWTIHKLPRHTDERRVLLHAELNLLGRQPIHAFVTHLSIHEKDREEQVKMILEIMRPYMRRDLVLMGDFNFDPGSGTYRQIRRHLKDLDFREPLPPTYPAKSPSHRFDYIFGSAQIEVEQQTRVDKGITSDHLAVIAQIQV